MITNPPYAAWARQGRSWIPRDEPSCGIWLRADLGVSLSSGKVAGWTNQASFGQSFTQGTSTRQPAYNANGFGSRSLPSIGFSAATTSSLVNSSISKSTSNWTMVFACNPTATSSATGLWLMDVVNGRMIFTHYQTLTGKVAFWDATASTYRGTQSPTTGAQILSFELAVNAGAIYRNGTALDTGLAWGAQRALASGITLGATNGGSAGFFEGQIAEVCVLQNPTSGARARVERYMGRRYGISVA